MTRTFDLNKMGLIPLSDQETIEISGDGFIEWVIKGVIFLYEHRSQLPPSPKPGGFVGGV